MQEGLNKKIFTKEQAEMEILAIRDQIAVMGANHSEIPDINRIIERLRNGDCAPGDAVAIAKSIMYRKHDDH